MLDLDYVKKVIAQYGMMDVGARKYANIVILLFRTLKEDQYACVNFFKDTLLEFGYELDKADAKVLQSQINQMVGKYLERVALYKLSEDKRMLICEDAVGNIRHDGQHRTRALFRLNSSGKASVEKVKNKFPLKI